MAMHMARCNRCSHRETTSMVIKSLLPDGGDCLHGHVGLSSNGTTVPMLDARGLSHTVEHKCGAPISPLKRKCDSCGFEKPRLGRLYRIIQGRMVDATTIRSVITSKDSDGVIELIVDVTGEYDYVVHFWDTNEVRHMNDDEFSWR